MRVNDLQTEFDSEWSLYARPNEQRLEAHAALLARLQLLAHRLQLLALDLHQLVLHGASVLVATQIALQLRALRLAALEAELHAELVVRAWVPKHELLLGVELLLQARELLYHLLPQRTQLLL